MHLNLFNRSRNKSTRNAHKTIDFSISPEQMFKLSMNKLDFGIEGYVTPRNYFDYFQVKWNKKREKILNSRKRIWPPSDWPRDKSGDKGRIKPKRITYIDEVQKWCTSYYDKKRATHLIEDKGINIKEYTPKGIREKFTRKEYLEKEERKREWRNNLPPYPNYKANAIEEAENNKREDDKAMEKDPIIKIRKKYKNHPQSSRCDKVSVISEAIYLGEQIPFYNTFIEESKYEKKTKLFFPNMDFIQKRFPAWRYPKPFGANVEIRKKQKEDQNQKLSGLMSSRRWKKEDLWVKVREAFNKVTDHGKILIRFSPEYKYKETIQYKTMKQNRKPVYIGPQQYWRMPKENPRIRHPKKIMETVLDDKGHKIYYLDRKITDRKAVTPGIRRSIY